MEKIVFSILMAIAVLTIISLPSETFGQTIKITKNATNADGAFDFIIFNATNPSNSTAVSIPNTAISNMTTPIFVIPGNYSVTETVPSGWILDASDCEINSISQGTTLNFNVTFGDSIECIFENTMDDDILEAILTEVTNIEEKLDGDRPSLITDIVTSLTTIQSDITQIFNLLTDPTFGLEEIKNEVRIIEGNVTSPEFGLQEIKSEITDIENILNNLNSTGIVFVTASDNFTATAGSNNESVLVTLNSTKYPIVVRTVYFNATTGTGTADLSAGERIRYDSLRVDSGIVNDPGTLQLIVSGANTAEKEQRILQVEAGNANLHRLFPFGINGDMRMAINLDSIAGAAVNDGFELCYCYSGSP